jgi:integrase
MKCLRPECERTFTPRANNRKTQKVCGLDCCRKWYKRHHATTAAVPHGMSPPDWNVAEAALKIGERLDTLILLGRETGLRKGELLGLSWGDVTDEAGGMRPVVAVRGQRTEAGTFKVTKGKGSRNAFLSVKARKWLAALNPSRRHRAEWIFKVSHPYAWEWWTAFQNRLGLRNPATGTFYRFHDLRHTLGTELVKKGRIDLAQKALGHASPATTMRYAERSPEELGADIENTRRQK